MSVYTESNKHTKQTDIRDLFALPRRQLQYYIEIIVFFITGRLMLPRRRLDLLKDPQK